MKRVICIIIISLSLFLSALTESQKLNEGFDGKNCTEPESMDNCAAFCTNTKLNICLETSPTKQRIACICKRQDQAYGIKDESSLSKWKANTKDQIETRNNKPCDQKWKQNCNQLCTSNGRKLQKCLQDDDSTSKLVRACICRRQLSFPPSNV